MLTYSIFLHSKLFQGHIVIIELFLTFYSAGELKIEYKSLGKKMILCEKIKKKNYF